MLLRRSFSILVLFLAFGFFLADANSTEARAGGTWPRIALTLRISRLDQPTHVTHAGDGSGRLFVTEQKGRILIVRGNTLLKKPFLDIRSRVGCCGEQGLLSVAFPPGYKRKRHFYVNYTNRSGDTVVARYRVTARQDIADPVSEEILLTIDQPYANHNGGQLAFGPDGYLYIGMGDGGSAGDPRKNGQKKSSLLGKLLRIDVESGGKEYAIPKDNPFAREKGYRPEIWALGLRNPWRFSFDRKTGDLYIADVGQNEYEEIHFQPASSNGGENYGWNIMEGGHCYRARTCSTDGLVLPIAEYDHSEGCSITGGMVYRGRAYPSLRGMYLYGDYCSGRIWGLRRSGAAWEKALLIDTSIDISTFGEDEAGNVYVADHGEGRVYSIEAVAK